MIVTLIPAAGASTRMRGKDKLLEPVQGNTPALRHAVEVALSAALGPVLVTLRPEDRARRVALQRAPVDVLDVPDAAEGMSASFRVGAARALEILASHHADLDAYSGLLVHLPDMPDIAPGDLAHLASAFTAGGGVPVRATTDAGAPGHPTLFPKHLLHDFAHLTGDEGARSLLSADGGPKLVPLQGDRAIRDLDTAEAWAAWRSGES